MLQSTALHEMMKRMPFRFGREGIFMDLQMVGEGQGALMGSGWMLKGNGGEFLSCLSRLNWDIGSKTRRLLV